MIHTNLSQNKPSYLETAKTYLPYAVAGSLAAGGAYLYSKAAAKTAKTLLLPATSQTLFQQISAQKNASYAALRYAPKLKTPLLLTQTLLLPAISQTLAQKIVPQAINPALKQAAPVPLERIVNAKINNAALFTLQQTKKALRSPYKLTSSEAKFIWKQLNRYCKQDQDALSCDMKQAMRSARWVVGKYSHGKYTSQARAAYAFQKAVPSLTPKRTYQELALQTLTSAAKQFKNKEQPLSPATAKTLKKNIHALYCTPDKQERLSPEIAKAMLAARKVLHKYELGRYASQSIAANAFQKIVDNALSKK